MTKIRKKFYSFFKYFMYIFLDFFTNIFFHIKNYKIKKSNEILITRIDNLGDFVVSLNILKKIREKIKKNPTFQNVKITFLCNDFLVELAKKTNLFDEIISVDAKKIFFGDNLLEISLNFENLAYRCKKLLKLKQKKYIKIIHLNNKYMTSFLLKNLYADKKIGMFDKIGNKNLNKFINKFYDKYIEIPDKNELKKLTYFFNKMFDGNIVTAPPSINFNINSKKHFILEKIENYCIFGLGASRNEKRFDIKKFVEIAKNEIFLNNKNLKIILLGSNSEIELGKLFLNFYGDDDNKKIINLIGKTSILDIFSIIKYSKFVLGNDSAYIHIATALNIPSICLLSGHNYGSFLPYQIDENENSRTIPTCITSTKMDCFGCGVICKFGLTKNKKYVCVENIDIKKIIDGIKNLNLE